MLETCVFLSLIITHQAPAIHESMIFISQFPFHIITHQCTIILSSVYILIVSFCSSPLPGCCILFPHIDSWRGRDWEISKDSHSSSGLLMLSTYQHHGDFALQNLFIPFLCLTILFTRLQVWYRALYISKIFNTDIKLNHLFSLQKPSSFCNYQISLGAWSQKIQKAPFVTTKYLLGAWSQKIQKASSRATRTYTKKG